MEKTFGLIMAGGGGTRLWPLSRFNMPKQLLNLTGKEIMINETIMRIGQSIDTRKVFIITNENQAKKMREVTEKFINSRNIISEPYARNTAACIGLAAMKIYKKYGDGVMVVTPSDAYVQDNEEYARVLDKAIEFARVNNNIVTIGIKPTYPATGYGYIKFEKTDETVKKVMCFVEKPNFELAKEYLESGNFLWNSGIFVWKVSLILECLKTYLPNIYNTLQEFSKYIDSPRESVKLKEIYENIESISIDFGVMEKANNIMVIEGNFGWNDVGSLDTLAITNPLNEKGNVEKGNILNLSTTNSVIYSTEKLIATFGLDNIVIVETKDAILVCPKDKAQDVKKIVEKLNESGNKKYL